MKTLEEITKKWNRKDKLNACNVTRVDATLVYVALNIDDRGNLHYQFAEVPALAKRLLDTAMNVTDSCVYHIDVVYKQYPQLVRIDKVQTISICELEKENILSHIQVKGYGIYKAVCIDIDEYDTVYTTYKHNLCKQVTYNNMLLPESITIRSTRDAVPTEVWDEVGIIYM